MYIEYMNYVSFCCEAGCWNTYVSNMQLQMQMLKPHVFTKLGVIQLLLI